MFVTFIEITFFALTQEGRRSADIDTFSLALISLYTSTCNMYENWEIFALAFIEK